MLRQTDCKKCNIVDGEIKESETQIENLLNFIKRWESKIKEIKTFCLDDKQAFDLARDYLSEWDKFLFEDGLDGKSSLLDQLSHDLYLAISQANVNYRKKFPTFWQNLHKLKLPDLHFHTK